MLQGYAWPKITLYTNVHVTFVDILMLQMLYAYNCAHVQHTYFTFYITLIGKTLTGNNVSGLTHTCPHKGRLKWTPAITRLTAHFSCGLIYALVIYKFWIVWSHMTLNVRTDTRCHQTAQKSNSVIGKIHIYICDIIWMPPKQQMI